jgi:hypothetical protein
MTQKKTGKIEFKLEEELLKDYKSLCEKNGFDMSKRLRLWIQKEIEFDKSGENPLSLLNRE